MDKVTLQEIKDLAKFIFDEKEYNKILEFITSSYFQSARVIIDHKMIELDLFESLTDDNSEIISQYEKCQRLEDLVMYLIIEDDEVKNGEGKQFRHITTEE